MPEVSVNVTGHGRVTNKDEALLHIDLHLVVFVNKIAMVSVGLVRVDLQLPEKHLISLISQQGLEGKSMLCFEIRSFREKKRRRGDSNNGGEVDVCVNKFKSERNPKIKLLASSV